MGPPGEAAPERAARDLGRELDAALRAGWELRYNGRLGQYVARRDLTVVAAGTLPELAARCKEER